MTTNSRARIAIACAMMSLRLLNAYEDGDLDNIRAILLDGAGSRKLNLNSQKVDLMILSSQTPLCETSILILLYDYPVLSRTEDRC